MCVYLILYEKSAVVIGTLVSVYCVIFIRMRADFAFSDFHFWTVEV